MPRARKISADVLYAFRERYGVTHEELELLFGQGSDGRTSRRWHKDDAPYYIGLLMAYVDRYGFEVLEQMLEDPDYPILLPDPPDEDEAA